MEPTTAACGARNGDFSCALPKTHNDFPIPGAAEHAMRWRDPDGQRYSAWWFEASDEVRIEPS